jgi:protein phosphatase
MEPLTDQQRQDELLDLADVAGKRLIPTRIHHTVSIREENGIAALEVMARFAVNPKWLIYLPPTMSPAETSDRPGLLEHPFTAFDYFQREGVERLICQEKHMGSRAVVICCRDEETARKRFGILEDGAGCCYTRSGRRFFDDPALETAVLGEVRGAMERSGLWDALSTDWVCLDCELMPWSAKAQALIREQYAPVGAAALASLSAASAALSKAAARGLDVTGLRGEYEERGELARRYAAAYQRYCWEVTSPADLKLAPFHLLASEGACHADRSHLWHMEHLGRLFGAGSGILLATRYRLVEAADPGSRAEATAWWEELTAAGGEGMVVKPLEFTARRANPQGSGLVQPAVKCRGAEYLRIIYGPEYSRPEHLERLRKRGLAAKRSLALREFALGVEALERFVAREPLRRVHECVFGVLALESEPVDPRL